MPNYRRPSKTFRDGRQFFTVYRDLKKVAKRYNLPFDVSRPKGGGTLNLLARDGLAGSAFLINGRKQIWFLTEQGDTFAQDLCEGYKLKPSAIHEALVIIAQVVSSLREVKESTLGFAKTRKTTLKEDASVPLPSQNTRLGTQPEYSTSLPPKLLLGFDDNYLDVIIDNIGQTDDSRAGLFKIGIDREGQGNISDSFIVQILAKLRSGKKIASLIEGKSDNTWSSEASPLPLDFEWDVAYKTSYYEQSRKHVLVVIRIPRSFMDSRDVRRRFRLMATVNYGGILVLRYPPEANIIKPQSYGAEPTTGRRDFLKSLVIRALGSV